MNEVKKAVIIAVTGLLIACGTETLAILFIPAFSATWSVQGSPDWNIDINGDDQNGNVHAGAITGFEFHDSDPSRDGNELVGSFDGLDIEFTIQRPTGNVQYTGKMTPVSDEDHTITRIEMESSEGPMVLSND